MARVYAKEMAKLAETFLWASTTSIKPLRRAVHDSSLSPLRAIGSGGSLTSAYALTSLHRRYTGQAAFVATPLVGAFESLSPSVTNWLLSAGGSNTDIMAIARALIQSEPRQLSVLCGGEASPLAKLCRQHPYVDLHICSPPTGKDGFLATNSLLASVAALTRAYVSEFGSDTDWRDVVDCLEPLISDSAAPLESWRTATNCLRERSTVLVLYGPSTRIGAIDLESKFTEAALGHVQLADYRNFAHGRHHWLAKRGESSSVLAFVTDEDQAIADRTLDLIPEDVPQAHIAIEGGRNAAGLGSLVAALRITGWVGLLRKIDPGRPGVPEFGRKLYRLPLPRIREGERPARLTRRQAAAIIRKSGFAIDRLAATGTLEGWRNALQDFSTKLYDARFAGIAIDYDGTVVDTRYRYQPADPNLAEELTRIAKSGIHVAIATGRGKSIRTDLQNILCPTIWPLILIGYYNGAEIAPLDDDTTPDGSPQAGPSLRPVAECLRRQPEISRCVDQEDRPYQISLNLVHATHGDRVLELVHHVIHLAQVDDVSVTRSAHSIDILAPGVSKLNTVERLRSMVGDSPILTVGDRGRWPGNDFELLSLPYALGVDEISPDPTTCWHLGRPGQRGPTVTLEYLSALEQKDGLVGINPRILQ